MFDVLAIVALGWLALSLPVSVAIGIGIHRAGELATARTYEPGRAGFSVKPPPVNSRTWRAPAVARRRPP